MNLKKLISRKDLALITDLIQELDPTIVIRSVDGQVLIGQGLIGQALIGQSPLAIVVDEKTIGWVEGAEYAAAIAAFFSYLAAREQEKRTLAKELLSKYKEISLLFNLSEKVVDSFDIRDVALLTLEESCQLLDSSHGIVLLPQEGSQSLSPVASYGRQLPDESIQQLSNVIWTHLREQGRGDIVNDLQPNSPCRLAAVEISGLVYVPLKSKEQLMGAIVLARQSTKPYKAEDAKILATLATQASGFIGALLHERKLKESRQNDLIFRLSSQIRDSLQLDVILATAVKEIQLALQLDRCLFLWCEWAGDVPLPTLPTGSLAITPQDLAALHVVMEAKQDDIPSLLGRHWAVAAGEVGVRLAKRSRVMIPNVINDPEQQWPFLQERGLGAFLAMPLKTRSRRIGVLCCGMHGVARNWRKDEVALLDAVINQLAIAIDQAELYEQSQAAVAIAEEKAQQLETAMSQLKAAQVQLVQSEKMSGLGQLVAGLAHEINNPVNFIDGNLTYIQHYVNDLLSLIATYEQQYPQPNSVVQAKINQVDLPFLQEDLPRLWGSMQTGTRRIQDIIRSLRNFSRLDETGFKLVNIHEGLESTLAVLEHRLQPSDIHRGIQLRKRYSEIPLVNCDPGELNQVFLNLITNAIEALEAASQNRQLIDEPMISIHTELLDEATVLICISDNGPGVPEYLQPKLFDPFFTTKDVGKGTGLGLSISYQIITEQHQGTLTCHSRPGDGAIFAITLPLQPIAV